MTSAYQTLGVELPEMTAVTLLVYKGSGAALSFALYFCVLQNI